MPAQQNPPLTITRRKREKEKKKLQNVFFVVKLKVLCRNNTTFDNGIDVNEHNITKK